MQRCFLVQSSVLVVSREIVTLTTRCASTSRFQLIPSLLSFYSYSIYFKPNAIHPWSLLKSLFFTSFVASTLRLPFIYYLLILKRVRNSLLFSYNRKSIKCSRIISSLCFNEVASERIIGAVRDSACCLAFSLLVYISLRV